MQRQDGDEWGRLSTTRPLGDLTSHPQSPPALGCFVSGRAGGERGTAASKGQAGGRPARRTVPPPCPSLRKSKWGRKNKDEPEKHEAHGGYCLNIFLPNSCFVWALPALSKLFHLPGTSSWKPAGTRSGRPHSATFHGELAPSFPPPVPPPSQAAGSGSRSAVPALGVLRAPPTLAPGCGGRHRGRGKAERRRWAPPLPPAAASPAQLVLAGHVPSAAKARGRTQTPRFLLEADTTRQPAARDGAYFG